MSVKKGLAFVAVNSNYKNFPILECCQKDGIDMKEKLEELGFDIMYLCDFNISEFFYKVKEFKEVAEAYSTILFYYSGHGSQVDGVNYLVPIDSSWDNDKEVFTNLQLIKLGIISDYMLNASEKTSIIILDACRDCPNFSKGVYTGGLAPLTNGGSGNYIAFATEPNMVARANLEEGDNSVYTKFLLKHIDTINLKIEDMFKRVRQDVENATQGNQKTWDNISLKKDFYFNTLDKDNIDEMIYQFVRNYNGIDTIMKLAQVTDLPISEVIRRYEHQKNERVGGMNFSSNESFEAVILQRVLSYGFTFDNYRWSYKGKSVRMGEIYHNPNELDKIWKSPPTN